MIARLWRSFWSAFWEAYEQAEREARERRLGKMAHAELKKAMTRYGVKRGNRYMAGRES